MTFLAELIGEENLASFFANHFPDRHGVFHGPIERLHGLRAVPALFDLRMFARQWTGDCSVWAPNLAPQTGLRLSEAEFVVLRDAGCSFHYRNLEQHIPELVPVVRALERDFGLREGDALLEAFVGSQGSFVDPHFDATTTFNVQLLGEKRWRLAANPAVIAPSRGCGVGEPATGELVAQLSQDLLEAMPNDAESIDVRPGSVVFLPHGTLHETRVTGDSFAILLTIQPPTFAGCFGAQFLQRLLEHESWRQPAYGPQGAAADSDESRQRVWRELLADMTDAEIHSRVLTMPGGRR